MNHPNPELAAAVTEMADRLGIDTDSPAAGIDTARACEHALAEAGGDTRVALITLLADTTPARASAALEEAGGAVREALLLLEGAQERYGLSS